MWLVFTNRPDNVPRANLKKWSWLYARDKAMTSNRTVDDRLWWAYRRETTARQVVSTLRELNKGLGMRLTIKNVKKIPDGWA